MCLHMELIRIFTIYTPIWHHIMENGSCCNFQTQIKLCVYFNTRFLVFKIRTCHCLPSKRLYNPYNAIILIQIMIIECISYHIFVFKNFKTWHFSVFTKAWTPSRVTTEPRINLSNHPENEIIRFQYDGHVIAKSPTLKQKWRL